MVIQMILCMLIIMSTLVLIQNAHVYLYVNDSFRCHSHTVQILTSNNLYNLIRMVILLNLIIRVIASKGAGSQIFTENHHAEFCWLQFLCLFILNILGSARFNENDEYFDVKARTRQL